jgi:hypothetical protein
MITFIALLALAAPVTDPAFIAAKQMVGGTWTGNMGPMIVEFKFTLEQDGTLIHGHGSIRQGSKILATMDSCYGWDPVAKNVYYLDRHNGDTVYFGRLVLEGKELVSNFKGLAGDAGEYVIREHFEGPDTYTFRMWERKAGQLADVHADTSLHRH